MAKGGWDKRTTCVEEKKKKAEGEERNMYLDEKNKIMGKIK